MSSAPKFTPSDAPSIPSGTVTFAFTDIEGSTQRWDRDRAAMQDAVRRHDAIVRASIAAHRGHVFKTIGDAFCVAFSRPEEAVAAMLDAQRALGAEDFIAVDGLRVRMAIHTGTADERDGDYFGPAVNRVARLLGIAHGAQVILSRATGDLVLGDLPQQAGLRDLGEHRLRDLARPEHVYQLLAPDLRADFPPLRSLDTLANNLPPQVTSFVGRETEIAEISALLGQHRLVTLTGSGGVGKTRTSLQVAANAVDGIGDGVWFIELAPLSSGDYVPTTIAQTVGVTLGAHGDPVDQLVAALKSKNMLLVFDNCEHLIDASARIVAALINACPRITILASSRQGLGIVGEATFRMPSLPVPPATAAGLRADAALPFAAIALFVERAQAVDNRFALTDENAPSVADICRRLDGIALAIELAAARAKMLSPQQLRDRLAERFRILTNGGRDRLPRQQTLRALIDWSHDLLDEREQRLFRRLGVFANGFTLEAASAVGVDEEIDAFAVFDLLASLVDKSLVMADPNGDSLRYHLLESTRVYAVEKLIAAGERDTLASRHLRYFRDWFVELHREREQLRDGLEAAFATELEDLRVALDGALVRREFAEGAKLLAAIGTSWWHSGGLGPEGIARCEAFLAQLPRSEPLLLGELGASLTNILSNMGRFTHAREAGVAATVYARASGDGATLAAAINAHAYALLFSSDFTAGARALSEAEAIDGVSPLRRLLLAECRANLSMETGDLDSAARTFTRLREEWRSAGFRRNEALIMMQLGDIEFRRGQHQRAAELLYEAIALARNDRTSTYFPTILVVLGQVLAVSEAVEAAIGPVIEVIGLWARREPGHVHISLAIEVLAYIAAAQGDLDRSARLIGYADVCLARIGFSRDYAELEMYERLMTRLNDQLAPDELARLRIEGAALDPEAAIALARTVEANTERARMQSASSS